MFTSRQTASASSLVFPEGRETISRATQVAIAGILEGYSQKGEEFSSKGIDFAPISILSGISTLYLNKKYGTNCFMYGSNSSITQFIHGGFRIEFLSERIPPITPDFLTDFLAKNLIQIQNFLKCVKSNSSPVIIVPLGLVFPTGGHHANMLIYKRILNTFEHFEPHGQSLSLDPSNGDKITTILRALVDKINELNNTSKQFSRSLPNDIRLVPSNEVCIRDSGLQSIQEQTRGFAIEQGEYCQMWSFLFAELSLLNPSVSSRDILSQIYRLLESKDQSRFLTNVIRGYVSMLGEGVSMYLSEYINNEFTIENMSYIFSLFEPYAKEMAYILQIIIDCEVNAEMIVTQMQITIPKIEGQETKIEGALSNYFRIQQEVKDLLASRKRNYTVKGKDRVDAEIRSKLMEELDEYLRNKGVIKTYIQNKVFKNFLRSRQSGSRKGGKKYKKTKKYKKGKKGKNVKKSRKYKK